MAASQYIIFNLQCKKWTIWNRTNGRTCNKVWELWNENQH